MKLGTVDQIKFELHVCGVCQGLDWTFLRTMKTSKMLGQPVQKLQPP